MKTKFLLVFISAWLFITLTVDLLVLPQAFKVIGDVWIAGNLGIELFRHFNPLEVFFSLLLLVLFFLVEKEGKKKIGWKFIFPLLLFFIALIYQFYLTPNIISTTRVILSLKGQTSELLAEAQLSHHFFHTSYIRLDVVKLLCLLLFLGIIIWPSKVDFKNDSMKERIGI